VGSTKRAIMNAASTALPDGVFFIGGHPMAGSERKGLEHSRAGIYRGATWALCAPPGAEAACARLVTVIEALEARPLYLDAGTHDLLVAHTSHLPHVVAAALTNVVLGGLAPEATHPFIAGGFRDTTRIAASSPAMWRDICLTNRDYLLTTLDALTEELARWREAIGSNDAPHLEALFTLARDRREEVTPPT
jgi:prephenate dehydrogenase